LRVVTRERTFDDLLRAAFDQISSSARGNLSVLGRMLAGLQAAGAASRDVERRQNLDDYASRMHETRDSLSTSHERSSFERILDRTRTSLKAPEDDAP
jgi:uncharacterized membrane protein